MTWVLALVLLGQMGSSGAKTQWAYEAKEERNSPVSGLVSRAGARKKNPSWRSIWGVGPDDVLRRADCPGSPHKTGK